MSLLQTTMASDNVVILIDDRETPERQQILIQKAHRSAFETRVNRLDAGDYVLLCPGGKTVAFEHKVWKQFCQDWKTGQLDSQLVRLRDSADYAALLVEEPPLEEIMKGDKFTIKCRRHLHTIAFEAMPVITVTGFYEAAEEVLHFARRFRDGRAFQENEVYKGKTRLADKYTQFLLKIPNLGPHRVRAIRLKYKSFEDFYENLDNLEHDSIPGIAEGNARIIREFLRNLWG